MRAREELKKLWNKQIADKLGKTVEEIKFMSPEKMRLYIETKNKKKITFYSAFPFIGRGNVLRDGIITSEEINKEIDKILGLK